jgi:hypothetical protein
VTLADIGCPVFEVTLADIGYPVYSLLLTARKQKRLNMIAKSANVT